MRNQILQAEKIISREILQETSKILKIAEKSVIILPIPNNDSKMAFKHQTKTRRFMFDRQPDIENVEHKISKAKIIKSQETKYTDDKINNYVINGIDHNKYLMSENRKSVTKNKIISELDKETKIYRDLGENRLQDPEAYVEQTKLLAKSYFDSQNYLNSELRGHRANMHNQMNEYFSIEDGGVSAVSIISEVEIKSSMVSHHSKLYKENADSQKNASEIIIARKFAKVTGKEVYVTGDNNLDDPEIREHLEGRNFIEPKRASQTTLDFLVTSVDSGGKKKTESADGKLRSLNTALSKEPVSRPFDTDTLEVWSVGTASVEVQKKVHKNICKNALEVCDKQKPSKDVDDKRAEIQKYEMTGNPKHLDKAKFVAVVIFNNDMNFSESQEC